MRRVFRLFGLVAVLVVTHTVLSQAQEPPAELPLRIAILDIDRVLREASAVKTMREQMRTYVDAYRSDTQREEEEMRTAQQELARKRTLLSAEAFAAEREDFEKRLIQAQEKVQSRKRALDRVQADAMRTVQGALNRVVTEIARDRELTLILRKDKAVLVAKPFEITDEVLVRLNGVLPSVTLPQPEP